MPCGLVLCSPFLLLVHAFATHRSVAGDVACGLLAAAEQLVEQSHVLSPSSLVRFRVPKRQQKHQSRRTLRFIGSGDSTLWPSRCLGQGGDRRKNALVANFSPRVRGLTSD